MSPTRFVPLLVALGAWCAGCSSVDVLGARAEALENVADSPGEDNDPETPRNILLERDLIPLSQVNARVNDAFLQLFFGDPETEAVFRDQGDGTGYIEDIANNDVRTDSMGYGMMVAVQLDQREVFDKLWSWTKTYMMSPDGASEGLLRWRCDTSGDNCDSVAATDSSSVIATSLFIAASRWGDEVAADYDGEARALLALMTSIEERNGGVVDGVRNLFDPEVGLPRASSGGPVGQVPADYLMPAFYEIWAEHDADRSEFWLEMTARSRSLLAKIPHNTTGLVPKIVTYDGAPVADQDDYGVTTHRVHLNTALDHSWYGPHQATITHNTHLLDFFLTEGVNDYVSEYTIEGEPLSTFNTSEHRALVALAAGTVESDSYDVFLQALLDEPIPTGTYRYYDGMLYMLSLLSLSGQMAPG